MVQRVGIGKVQVRGALGAEHALRLALPTLIARADLVPPGLPPQGILIVQRMSDPRPGELVKSLRSKQVSREWEQQARRQMAEFYRHAAKPVRGSVSANAEAVLFLDESELLACLLRDLTHGNVLQRWWWQSVLRSGSLGRKPSSQGEVVEAVARQMTQKAHLVPGLLKHLEVWGQASSALHILSAEQAGRVLQAVLQAYMLPRLPEGKSPGPPYLPPWSSRRIIPVLGKERTALLGLCLDLQERPQIVRAASYQEQLQYWWRSADSEKTAQVVGASATPERATSSDASSIEEIPESRVGDRDAPSTLSAGMEAKRSALLNHAEDSPVQPNERRLKRAVPEVTVNQMDEVEEPPVPKNRASQANVEARAPAMQPESESLSSAPQPEMFAWLSGGVPTRLGGVLYLINLMAHLDLPDCFEEDWRLSSRLGSWGLLEVLARALFGEAIEGFEDDLLWRALAQLDGRHPGEPPGLLMPRSRPGRWPKFRVPEPWLRGLPADAIRLSRPRYRSKRFRNINDSPWLQRWLDLALPFIAYRLRLALRLPEEASLAESLLIMPGRIYVTSSHVDLAASVEQISLPVRLAGLDRDPGWMPEFGRVIYFHFLE